MAREPHGIEIFGRATKVIEIDHASHPRTALAGVIAAALAIAAAVCLGLGVHARAISDLPGATALAWAALACSVLAVAGGLFALVTGRGRRAGIFAFVLGALANPWLLTRLLEHVSSLSR